MTRMLLASCIAVATCGILGVAGCEREVSHTKEVKVNDGSVRTKEQVVTERPDGTIHSEKTETKREVHD